MKVIAAAEAFSRLRDGRAWSLLAANLAPQVLALLQTVLGAEERALPYSVLVERLAGGLDELRANGHSLAQTPQAYVADWLTKGWVTRRFKDGDEEESYALTSDTMGALRYVNSLLKPRSAATESRLVSVMQQVVTLAEESNPDPQARLQALEAERQRIQQEMDALAQGNFKTLSDERALERAQEVIGQARELVDDFQRVRAAFEQLNIELRQRLLESDGSRGAVLQTIFAGVDLIAESDAGRTFDAFWRLLTDPVQSLALESALDGVAQRGFARQLPAEDRHFLQDLLMALMIEAASVRGVVQSLARGLKNFVQSNDYTHSRRVHTVLRQAQAAALAAREHVKPGALVGFSLSNTVAHVRSVSVAQLYDPGTRQPAEQMADVAPSDLSLSVVEDMVQHSDINFRSLRARLRSVLRDKPVVTLGQLLEHQPAEQGFGTVLGLISLGARHGVVGTEHQIVRWTGLDGVQRAARVPAIHFNQEHLSAIND